MTLKRVAQTYLVEQQASKAVVAPFAKRETLEQLGFTIQQVQ
jgi:hypothetical protein